MTTSQYPDTKIFIKDLRAPADPDSKHFILVVPLFWHGRASSLNWSVFGDWQFQLMLFVWIIYTFNLLCSLFLKRKAASYTDFAEQDTLKSPCKHLCSLQKISLQCSLEIKAQDTDHSEYLCGLYFYHILVTSAPATVGNQLKSIPQQYLWT